MGKPLLLTAFIATLIYSSVIPAEKKDPVENAKNFLNALKAARENNALTESVIQKSEDVLRELNRYYVTLANEAIQRQKRTLKKMQKNKEKITNKTMSFIKESKNTREKVNGINSEKKFSITLISSFEAHMIIHQESNSLLNLNIKNLSSKVKKTKKPIKKLKENS